MHGVILPSDGDSSNWRTELWTLEDFSSDPNSAPLLMTDF